jgi:hypothetical protein
MIDHGDDVKRDALPLSRAAIPGDPFPWEPAVQPGGDAEDSSTPSGATPTPADSGDPSSFDLGGGD